MFEPKDLLRAWGGERLSISQPSLDIVRLRFHNSQDNENLDIRIPAYLKCLIGQNSHGVVNISFQVQTPCENASLVKYGDYIERYVNRGLTNNGLSVPARNSIDYNLTIPYMRWVCKSIDDQTLTIVTI